MSVSVKAKHVWHRFTLNYPGIKIAFCVALGVWLLSLLGGLSLPAGWLYDRYSQLAFDLKERESQVLLVQARPEAMNERSDYWLELLKAVETLEPTQVGFLFVPLLANNDFFEQAAAYSNVHFAIGRRKSADDDSSFRWQAASSTLEAAGLLPTSRVLAVPQNGIMRMYASSTMANGIRYESLALAMARYANQVSDIDDKDPFYINFINTHERIPIVTAERVTGQGLITELTQGKHVIIGIIDDLYEAGLTTPLQGDGLATISMLKFHGHALDTLLSRQNIVWLQSSVTFALIIILALLAMIFYQWLNIRQAGWLSLLMLLLYLIAGWLSMSLFKLNLPIIELILTQLLMFLLIFRFIAETEDTALRQMLLSRTKQLHEKSLPASFYSSDKHWAQVITMVNQVLDLNRTIFLESIENDHRVREIVALHCSIDDLDERRRDYQRTPYSTAIEIKGPLLLEKAYLRGTAEDETQYLIPLIFAGEVLGFWALGIASEKVESNKRFVSTVKLFSSEIAEMLYHRQQWRARQLFEQSHWRRYIRLEAGEVVYKSLNQSLSLLDRHMNTVENVFDGMGTAAILYDLFGRVVQVNRCMEACLQEGRLPAYDMTALDLMHAVSGIEKARCRQFLQFVILQHDLISLPATLPGVEERSFVLNIKALQNKRNQVESQQAQPFQLSGILFELLDVTYMKKMYGLKEKLVKRLNYQLRNDLESILLASDLISNQKVSQTKSKEVIKIVGLKVHDAVNVIEQVQKHLDFDVDANGFECYPINVLEVVHKVIAELSEFSRQRNVRIEKNIPAVMKLGFADQTELSSLLEQMLKHLISDAEEGSIIKVSIHEDEKTMTLNMSNQGFGLPSELMQTYLFGDAQLTSQEFKQLRHLVNLVGRWGANVDVDSEIGRGTTFKLLLRGFY